MPNNQKDGKKKQKNFEKLFSYSFSISNMKLSTAQIKTDVQKIYTTEK